MPLHTAQFRESEPCRVIRDLSRDCNVAHVTSKMTDSLLQSAFTYFASIYCSQAAICYIFYFQLFVSLPISLFPCKEKRLLIFPFNAQIQLVSQASCNWLHFVFFCIILKGLVLFLAATKKKKENASFFFSRAFVLAGTANALTDVITRRENTSRAENTGKKTKTKTKNSFIRVH
jgi:hypothetical protein